MLSLNVVSVPVLFNFVKQVPNVLLIKIKSIGESPVLATETFKQRFSFWD